RLVVTQRGGERARPDQVSSGNDQRVGLLGPEPGDVRREPRPSTGRDGAIRKSDGAGGRLEGPVKVIEGQEAGVNTCGCGGGGPRAQAARASRRNARCMDLPACTDPARVPTITGGATRPTRR